MVGKDAVRGVIAYVPTVFDEHWDIDEQKNRQNMRRLVDARVDAIHATGGSAEFYALTFEQHEKMCRILVEETKGSSIGTIAGCGAHSTEDAIERATIAKGCGADAALFITPYYFATTPAEVIGFFADIAAACPDLPLVHFNTGRSKTVLTGEDYRELEQNSSVIGVKHPSLDMWQWYDVVTKAPRLRFFSNDMLLVPSFLWGAAAVDSLVAATSPKLVILAVKLCQTGQWEAASRVQTLIWRLSEATNCLPALGTRSGDCSIDKACVEAAGFLHAGKPKPPYLPVGDADMKTLRANTKAFDEQIEQAVVEYGSVVSGA